MDYLCIPILSGQGSSRQKFRDVYSSAALEFQRNAMFGDSQETNPSGAGRVYIEGLNVESFREFGQAPESPTLPAGSNTTGLFAARTSRSLGSTITGLNTLPNLVGYSAGPTRGSLNLLLPNGDLMEHFGPGEPENQGELFWDQGQGNTKFQVFVRTDSSASSGLTVTQGNNSNDFPDFFGAQQTYQSGDIGLNLTDGEVKMWETPVLVYDPQNINVHMVSRGDDTTAQIVAGRFVNPDIPQKGMIFSSFSAGGYRSFNFLANHPDAGPTLNALGPWSCIFLQYGANDSANSTPEKFCDDVRILMETMRGPDWLDNPEQLICIVSEDFRTSISNQSFYARCASEIARETPNTVAFNLGRITHNAGFADKWNDISDGVHITSNEYKHLKAKLFLEWWGALSGEGDHDDGGGNEADPFTPNGNLNVTFFNEQQFSFGFGLQNTTDQPLSDWSVQIANANYQIDATQLTNNNAFNLVTTDNGDGTFTHTFVGLVDIPAFGALPGGNVQWNGVNFGFAPESDGLASGTGGA